MGKYRKPQPTKLAQKLLSIRRYFDFTQEQMIGYVMPDAAPTIARAALSDFESGRRTPSLLEILNYAKAVRFLTVHKNFNVEILLDDKLGLPFRCPGSDDTRSAEKEQSARFVSPPKSSNNEMALGELNQTISEPSSVSEKPVSASVRTPEVEPNASFKIEGVSEKNLPVSLPELTLTEIDNIRLELLKMMPFCWRAQFDLAQFIELLLRSVAADHQAPQGQSPLIEEIKEMIAELPVNDE